MFRTCWLCSENAGGCLRDDGTFWLNYGDAYAGGGRGAGGLNPDSKQATNAGTKIGDIGGWKEGGWKPKNLMLMPARLAIALQDDGWILRSEVIWHKPNPMPESVIDRPTSSHEKMYLFSKQTRYFYDHVAVRTGLSAGTLERFGPAGSPNARNGRFEDGTRPDTVFSGKPKTDKQSSYGPRHAGFNERYKQKQVSARRQAFLDGERVNDKTRPKCG